MVDIIDKALRMGEGHQLKKLENVAKAVNALEDEISALSDEDLKAQTPKFKQEIENGKSLDEIMPEAFATVREVSKRTLGQRHFDVQLMGGAALHWGNIAEMKTGEGKTLVATLPTYLNALEGKGVHVVTVNDYLASYQSELMGRIYRFLGMNVGCIITEQKPPERRKQYNADITYGTNNEFGFDYLRDNMAWEKADLVQRGHHYAIVDEVDSILIDEARTPLIISGPAEGDVTRWYRQFAKLVLKLTRDEDYDVDEKKKVVGILDPGITKVEDFLGIDNLYEPANTALIGYLNNAIKAKELFLRDKDYVVTQGEVLIVDEHTGRILPGRRYNEGLHQAIEAKEGVEVKAENQTFATITLQNYFRMYDKLAGMTGTAETEAAEFMNTYKLGVLPIKTNKPMIRKDQDDLIYRTKKEKLAAIVKDVAKRHAKGQPVLLGTASVESSEVVSTLLDVAKIPHQVLNAKQHEKEAAVVAVAGRKGAVTVATNMAGRGTDIKLTPEVKAAGGLAIIGTERHESRRVDRQLRGRAGRQGDPGSSQFFVSLEDDLMRLFGSGRIASMMDRMGLKEGEVIQAGMMTRAIERAQKKVEENNFGIRKRLLEYDDVMNSQREVIYTRRRHALYGERIEIDLNNIMYDYADNFVEVNRGIEFEDFRFELIREVAIEPSFDEATYGSAKPAELAELIVKDLKDAYARRAKSVADTVRPVMERIYEDRKEQLDSNIYFPITDGHLGYNVPVNLLKCKNSDGAEIFRVFSKVVMFTSIDDAWREHLREMDDLRQSVQNATYEQKDPLLIYKFESFGLFSKMIVKVNRDVLAILNKAYIPVRDQNAEAVQRERQERAKVDVNKLQASRMQAAAQAGQQDKQKPMPLHVEKKVGRNDPCPCGSGKKYKQCHGKGI